MALSGSIVGETKLMVFATDSTLGVDQSSKIEHVIVEGIDSVMDAGLLAGYRREECLN